MESGKGGRNIVRLNVGTQGEGERKILSDHIIERMDYVDTSMSTCCRPGRVNLWTHLWQQLQQQLMLHWQWRLQQQLQIHRLTRLQRQQQMPVMQRISQYSQGNERI